LVSGFRERTTNDDDRTDATSRIPRSATNSSSDSHAAATILTIVSFLRTNVHYYLHDRVHVESKLPEQFVRRRSIQTPYPFLEVFEIVAIVVAFRRQQDFVARRSSVIEE